VKASPAAALLLAACVVAGACSAPSSPRSSVTASPSSGASSSPPVSLEWPEYHRDAGRSGAGPAEPALTTPKMAWNAGVDGDLYASPLIVAGHVIAATENNTVYSLDVFTGAMVWQRHLGDPVDASTLPCGNIGPVTGITGTPAADPSTGRLYVVAFLRGYHHVLFALSLTDGSVLWQQTIDPAGSDARVQQLRGALAIGSGTVYVPFGGLFGDCGDYHGYLVGVPLGGGVARQYRVPAARGASIWAPHGPTIGPDGSVYVVTGNATSTSATFDYSDAVIQLSPDLATVRSYFAPTNWVELNNGDVDLGSTGAVVLPTLDRVFVIGKEGVGYLLAAGRLGGVGGQVASRRICNGSWGGTAWLGSLVYVPCSDGLYAVSVSPSSLSVAWHSDHPTLAPPMTAAGALWAVEWSTGTLYAFDPSSGKTLYRAGIGSANRYSTPAATEGFVVVPAGKKVLAISTVG
jgi:outer membrane protein assembly factor BamB